MELFGPILEIVKMVWTPIGKCLKYHRSLEDNMVILKSKLGRLNKRKEEIELEKGSQLCPRKKLKSQVEDWLADVDIIDVEIQTVKEEVEKGKYLSRARLGKRVANKIQEVEELLQKGSFPDCLVLDATPRKGETFPPTKLAGETTAKRKMEEIWDNLMDDVTRLIGVYGMGGSGKTTVMKEINNRLLEPSNKFDRVIWITVSKVLDVIKLQDLIATEFRVDLSGLEDKTRRAARLFSDLSKEKRYVLILDDVWEEFKLEDIGIPEPTIANGCKIVLTTRLFDICRNMRCKDIKMELLSKDEAWDLFLDIVGSDVSLTPNLEANMRLVAEECASLPLAIVTIAGSMKGVVDECEWSNTLEELREATGGLNDMEKVLKQLKHSYLRLKDKTLQHCLLYCALYPEDFEIKTKELVKYLISEGIIEGKSRQAEFNKGQTILNKLENACLLKISPYGGRKYVKMHDLIRDMALQIMSSRCMVQAGVQLIDLPYEEKWMQDIEWVSLRNNDIREIQSGVSPRCDKLSTLLLSQNKELKKIPNSFFLHMVGLRVLDLSYTGIENLPNSILDLENLAALLLKGCVALKYVPSLAKLRALRTLELGNTGIEEVPHGLEMLVNLRCLDLNAKHLKMLPIGILPKLSHLQCLIVWWGSKTLKVKAEEVAGLRQLEAFAGQFGDPHDLNTYIRSWQGGSRPHRYLLQVGTGDPSFSFDEEIENLDRDVILRKCSISRGGRDPLELPNDVRHLDIKECHDVISLCDVSSLKTNFLRWCRIQNCDGIEYLISTSSPYCLPFQSLEYLRLGELQNLRVLFKGEGAAPPPPGIFSCLEELNITDCPNIKKLFTPRLLLDLQNLKIISVQNCEGMEEIIWAKSGEEEQVILGESSNHSIVSNDDTLITITLPKLRSLYLVNLPELKSIVYGRGVMVCDSLWHIDVNNCPKLKRLPLYLPVLNGKPSPPPNLGLISGVKKGWWESLEWDHPDAKIVLQPFVYFI